MQDPVRGEFRASGTYSPHPNSNSFLQMMTGVVFGPGIEPTPGEAMHDTDGKWVGHDTLPALIDRAEPTNFQILWGEVVKIDERSIAQQQARQAADALRAGPAGAAASAPGSPVSMGKQQTPDATPEWAQGLVADLAARGMIPGLDANSLSGVTIDAPKVTIEVDGPAETGSPGTAVLRGVADIVVAPGSIPFPGGSMCTLTLEVSSPTGPYTVQTRLGFRSPQTRAAIAVPGRVLPVRIAANDPQHVTVDVPEFYRQNPELAL